jgi:hypothetical protein
MVALIATIAAIAVFIILANMTMLPRFCAGVSAMTY